ncbi:MAG TPA: hypothetical protein VNO23_07550 [Candidatus Binatia bacterium]|nr:hypothetical protein [Candidatus Binatia bacterium]
MIPRTVGQRVLDSGPRGPRYGRIVGLGQMRGEDVVYIAWEQRKPGYEDMAWLDTLRAADVIPVGAW